MKRRPTIYVRDMEQQEAPLCAEWIKRIADINLLDPEVLGYPATRILCAHEGGQPRLFVPVQRVAMVESLAPEPGSEGMVEGQCLRAAMVDIVASAYRDGIREVYFLCKDERVLKLAEGQGFERVNIPLVRLKVR